MSNSIEVLVDHLGDIGHRADVVLGRRARGLSRRVARALALGGALRCNGLRVPPSHRVRLGDRLELDADAEPLPAPAPRVLAVTDAFVYVDKPAGIHTHRLRPDDPPALADALATIHPECAATSDDAREGGALHRLDHGTTGVVAFARTPEAWRVGRRAVVETDSIKLYVALCETPRAPCWPPRVTPELATCETPPPLPFDLPPPQGASPLALTLPLGRGAARDRVTVRSDGRSTTSILMPLAFAPPLADGRGRLLVALQLKSGHRHQARVHLAWLGIPIEGDERYGHVGGALALHCSALDLSASCPGEQRVDAPLAAALSRRLEALALRSWA